MNKTIGIGIAVLAVAGVGAYKVSFGQSNGNQLAASSITGSALVEIALPEQLSENAQIGQRAYDASCMACHGPNAVGQDGVAPPLVHKIYEPGHHADESFQRAVALGVKSHHWRFGDMAPVEGLTRGDVKMIIGYVRELQRANGIN